MDRNYNSDYEDDGVEELNECPLCTEEFDVTDKNFNPCRCGYQICIWCWHKLMETAGGRCPNCRRIYDSNNLDFTPPDPTLIQTEKKKVRAKKHNFSRKQLVNVRVIQRNLVYVVGLTLDVAREDVGWLRRPDNFGKYGKITKVVINKSNLTTGNRPPNVRSPTVSAYITFARKEDAYRCIKAIDSTWLDSKLLRASFGTTKYCAYFLRGIPCTNPDCMYLHDYGDEEDTFNKEDIVLRNGLPVPHNSDKLSQFYPHLDDPSPCEKHFWNFKDSNVPPPDSFEAAYDEDDIYHKNDEEDQYDDIDAHDEDNMYEGDEDFQQWPSSSEEDEEPISTPIPTTEYAKDNIDPNSSILPSTARWGKKSPESKTKKKKNKKSKASKQPAPAPIQPPPLDVNNAWSTINKKATPQQVTPRDKKSKTTPITNTIPGAKQVEPVTPVTPKPPVVVAPTPQQVTALVKPVEKKVVSPPTVAPVVPVKQEEKPKEKPKQPEPVKKQPVVKKPQKEEKEAALVQDIPSQDEAILQEPIPIELDLPLETETFFSEKDQIHTPTPQLFAHTGTENAVLHNIPQPFISGVDPLISANSNTGGLWGTGIQSQSPQAPQKQQQFNNTNNFVHSLMQFGLGSADLASQLQQQQQQQYMQQFQYQPPQMPGAVDLGDLPWENNPFVEPTRTRSRFEFAQFGSAKTASTQQQQSSFSDTWKSTPSSTDQWGYSDLGSYNSSDLQQSFRALLPNVNINFSGNGMNTGSSNLSSESAWGFNQQPNQKSGQNISINNNINNINININNHHHTPNYSSNYSGYGNMNKDTTNTHTTTTTFSFGGNPFAGDSWGFNQTQNMFPTAIPQDPIFMDKEPIVEKPKPNTSNAPSNTSTNTASNKKGKGKKGKK